MKIYPAAFLLFAITCLGSLSAIAKEEACSYRLSLHSVSTKMNLPADQKIDISVSLPSNRDKGFWAIQSVASTNSGIAASESLALKESQEIEIHTDQIDLLKANFPKAWKGIDVIAIVQKGLLHRLVYQDDYLMNVRNFSNETQDSINAFNGGNVFDPRSLEYSAEGIATLTVNSEILAVNFVVKKSCQ